MNNLKRDTAYRFDNFLKVVKSSSPLNSVGLKLPNRENRDRPYAIERGYNKWHGKTIRLLLFFVFHFSFFISHAQSITNHGDTIYISKGATVQVKGSFNNTDNGNKYPYIYNNGTLRVDSNMQASAHTTYTGQDSFIASGADSQNIAGLHYYNFFVPNGGAKALNGNANIGNLLQLTNGTINTYADTITLNPNALIIENDTNAYVLGHVQITRVLSKGVRDSFGNIGTGITLGSNYPHTYDTIKCVRNSGFSAIVTGQVQPTGYAYKSIERNFKLTPTTNGHLGMTMDWHYRMGELDGVPEGSLATFRREDENQMWKYVGYSTRNTSTHRITNTGQDSLSEWTFGSSSDPLPIVLLNFEAVLINKTDGYLTWATASEINNNYFAIERSIDGKTWKKIGQVAGNGTTANPHNYNYTDPDINLLAVPVVYYQLKQVDYNGNATYSQVRGLDLTSSTANSLKVWYNQTEDEVYVNYYTDNATENLHLALTDMQGKMIVNQNVEAEKGQNQATLNMDGLARAFYNVTIVTNDITKTFRVLKE